MTTNALDNLIGRVDDSALRSAIESEVERLRSTKDFGLVFERHLPEEVRLLSYPIRRGVKVQERKTESTETWTVRSVKAGQATLIDADGVESVRDVEDLVVIRGFGEPIYPGLKSVGKIEQGGDKPFHSVINGENFYVLETLLYAYESQVDCIYIDPPYNSGARDWKYNNDYVDGDDAYRHSKWLSFMEKRLKLAKRLLNPDASALIVTIDEKEYLRLGLLLRQVFPEATMQMVSSQINPKGTGRVNEFRRVDEYLFFLWFGEMSLCRVASLNGPSEEEDDIHLEVELVDSSEEDDANESSVKVGLDWQTARRRDLASVRTTRPGQFYPIYVNVKSGQIEHVGEPIPHELDRSKAPTRKGCVAVFPVRPDGTEMNWGVTRPTFIDRWQKGYARAGKEKPGEPQQYIIQYLKSGPISDIEGGKVTITGRNPDGSVIGHYEDVQAKTPTTQWKLSSHNAEHYGTGVIKALLPGRSFPFPKSLYAVEDALKVFLNDRPDALVVDFFGGSGTTTHAVARLNHGDAGRRRSIVITNNEVSEAEDTRLRERGHFPGQPEWESLGIFEHITMPRVKAAITGKTPGGKRVPGHYKFTDEFPIAEGFEENVEFFELTYLDRNTIARGKAYEAIAPLLWMRFGATGSVITKVKQPYAMPKDARYAVLFDVSHWQEFVEALRGREDVLNVCVVTDSIAQFQQVAAEISPSIGVTMLYEDYLRNFEINTGEAS